VRFLGRISGGFPSAAEGMEDQDLDLHALLVRHQAATFFFRVRGDGLREFCIADKAILVVDRAVNPKPGALVLAESNGEFVVRKFEVGAPIIFCGVVVGVAMRL
jgi:DNA polymerase V